MGNAQSFAVDAETDHPCALLTGLRGNSRYALRVRSENSAGLSGVSEALVVRTLAVPPSAPGNPVAIGELSPTTCQLQWIASAEDGGSELLGYRIHCRPCDAAGRPDDNPESGIDLESPSGQLRMHFEGLRPRRRYRFRVRAWNSAGLGPPSGWSAALRSQAAAPKPPAVILTTPRTAVVTWDAQGAGDGSAVANGRPQSSLPVPVIPGLGGRYEADIEDEPALEYDVAVRVLGPHGHLSPGRGGGSPTPRGRPPMRVLRASMPPVQFGGLQDGASYIFRTRARGRFGWSAWSHDSQPCTTGGELAVGEICALLTQRCGSTIAQIFGDFDPGCDGFLARSDSADLDGLDIEKTALETVPEAPEPPPAKERSRITAFGGPGRQGAAGKPNRPRSLRPVERRFGAYGCASSARRAPATPQDRAAALRPCRSARDFREPSPDDPPAGGGPPILPAGLTPCLSSRSSRNNNNGAAAGGARPGGALGRSRSLHTIPGRPSEASNN